MKMRTKVFSMLACAVMAFAASSTVVSAATISGGAIAGSDCFVVGPDTVQKGSTNTYAHWCTEYNFDGTSRTYDTSLDYADTVEWSLGSSVAAGTTLANVNGYAVLTVAADETAGSIVINSYDTHFKRTTQYRVYVAGNESAVNASAPSDADPFWLGVHQSLTQGSKAVTVNADGHTFVPFYVLDALRGKNATLTITCGLDDYVINGKQMGNLRAGASYSFGNLADILNTKADPNSRGGVTYSTSK